MMVQSTVLSRLHQLIVILAALSPAACGENMGSAIPPPGTSHDIGGHIRDEQGRPIVGAVVEVYDAEMLVEEEDQIPLYSDLPEGNACTSNAQGRFLLGVLSHAQHRRRLRVRAAGKVCTVTPPASVGTRRLDISVEPGLTVRGQVLGPEGRPVAKAVVRVVSTHSVLRRRVPASASQAAVQDVAGCTLTDAQGRFLFSCLPKPPIDFQAEHGSFGTSIVKRVWNSEFLHLKLRTVILHSGIVVNTEGAPIHGAHVHLAERNAKSPHRSLAETDRRGGFAVRGMPGRQYELRVDARGFASHRHALTIGQASRARIVLASSAHLEVRVADLDGQPIHKPLLCQLMELDGSVVSWSMGNPGTLVGGIGREHILRVGAAGFETQALQVRLDEDDERVDINLASGGPIAGHVLVHSSHGANLLSGHMLVYAVPSDGSPGDSLNLRRPLSLAEHAAVTSKGAFVLRGLRNDRCWTLVVMTNGSHACEVVGPLQAGTTNAVIQLVPGRAASGRVVSRSGRRIEELHVYGNRGLLQATCKVDGEGHFTLKGLKKGEYSLRLWDSRDLV